MLRRIAPLALLATLAMAAAAQALPGDPPSEPIDPADGASVLVDADPIPVSFTCPVYRTFTTGDFTAFGGASDHGVSLSASPALGADGRLADPLSINPGQRDPAADGRCVSALGAGGALAAAAGDARHLLLAGVADLHRLRHAATRPARCAASCSARTRSSPSRSPARCTPAIRRSSA